MNIDDQIEYICKAVEAILFATGEAVTYQKLADAFSLTPAQIKMIVKDLSEKYEDRGIQLLCYDNSCQLCTKKEYEEIIKDVLGIKKNGALSKSCLETLAVIAYNQPVTRSYIDEVRGVDSSYAIGVLTQRELIEITGKLDVPGKPNLYSTNENFLRVFGLSSLSELPKVSVLSVQSEEGEASGDPAAEPSDVESTDDSNIHESEDSAEVV